MTPPPPQKKLGQTQKNIFQLHALCNNGFRKKNRKKTINFPLFLGATAKFCKNKILLPSARHLEEGRGTTILELLRQENCISTLCPRPLGSSPPPHTQIV